MFGQFDANIKKIEKEYSVSMILRDDKLKVSGSEEGVKKSIQVIEQLFQMADRGSSIDEQKVDYTISIVNEHPQEAKESLAQGHNLSHDERQADQTEDCRTENICQFNRKVHDSIRRALPEQERLIYLAMAKAITAFKNNEVGRIILQVGHRGR